MMLELEPSALHIGDEELPWVDFGPTLQVKVPMAKVS